MRKGITPIISVILLLLITISLVGTGFVFFNRVAQSSAEGTEGVVKQNLGTASEKFVVESIDRNKVYIRNLGTSDLTNLNFYINGVPISSFGTVPAGQAGTISLDDSQISQFPNAAVLKITSPGGVDEISTSLYKIELVAHWTFDDLSKGKYITDSSGKGNTGFFAGPTRDGTLINNPQVTDALYGNALNFDGTDDTVSLPADAAFEFGTSTDFTIEAWVKTSATAGAIVQKRGAGSFGANHGWSLRITGAGRLQTFIEDGENVMIEGTDRVQLICNKVINDDTWHHVAVLFDRDDVMSCYIDGVKDSVSISLAGIGSVTDNAKQVHIGSQDGSGVFFPGQIDEVRIYNRLLVENSNEINLSRNSKYPLPGVVGSYSFESIYPSGSSVVANDTHFIVQGNFGGAASFSGLGDYISVAPSPSLDTASAITLETWAKMNSAGTNIGVNEHLISKGTGNPTNEPTNTFDLFIISSVDYLRFRLSDGSDNEDTFNDPELSILPTVAEHFYPDRFYHLAATWDGTAATPTMKLYKNGVHIAAADQPSFGGPINVQPATPLLIGAQNSAGATRFFNGIMDEVRILNIARTMTSA